ncbi:PEP-CTERM sorting domain-containing protein [Paucibacter sp. O1-1]|nr:PEP-CTERM sorting domain-containing protein [Paucibacter sp. O1-1]MDA3825597.1 PEP-CTERM sorting domain-containing protein [Paucibacter sp. O1-1]
MKTQKQLAGAALVVAAALLNTAQAASFTLTPDGAWFEFLLAEGQSSWLDQAAEPASFSFSSANPFVLRVVDFFLPGDSTQVLSNGVLLGATPTVAFDDSQFADTPDAALGNPVWSQASWVLGPGSYTFTGLPGTLPTGSANLAISVTAVPEPASAAMLLAGLLGVVGMARRRRG